MSTIRRGGFAEPYCSDDCYHSAGREIGGTVIIGIQGTCGFCQRSVSVTMGSSTKLIPYRSSFLFICQACEQAGSNYVRRISECCMCGKPLAMVEAQAKSAESSISKPLAMKQGPRIGTLVKELAGQGNTNAMMAYNAAKSLGAIGVSAVPALTSALQQSDKWVRENGAMALSFIGKGAEGAVPALAKLLDDDDDYVRHQAGEALKAITGEESADWKAWWQANERKYTAAAQASKKTEAEAAALQSERTNADASPSEPQRTEGGFIGFVKKLFGGGTTVTFVKRYSENRRLPTGMATYQYEVYRAKTAQQAREFLQGKTVSERNTYIVVETPEGNWGKDIGGMYKERG